MFSDSMIIDQIARGRITITGGPNPFGEDPVTDVIQPASYELTLGDDFRSPATSFQFLGDAIVLGPRRFMLGTTAERVTLGDQVVAQVHGKSSLGRQGLLVHVTAGLVDPGFSGQITLELYNVSEQAITLHAGMRICQLTFEPVIGKVLRPYGTESLGSHYQNQTGATPSA